MKKEYLIISLLAAVAIVLGVAFLITRGMEPYPETSSSPTPVVSASQTPSSTASPQATVLPHSDTLHIKSPTLGATVSSPLVVTGEARGGWYFEASFPVKLLNDDGEVLAEAPAQAQEDWMTEEFVPFTVELKFTAPSGTEGTLVLENDNPSGIPEHAKRVEIPVFFE